MVPGGTKIPPIRAPLRTSVRSRLHGKAFLYGWCSTSSLGKKLFSCIKKKSGGWVTLSQLAEPHIFQTKLFTRGTKPVYRCFGPVLLQHNAQLPGVFSLEVNDSSVLC